VINVGVLGAGYWGPKHIRNYSELPGANMAMVSDLSAERLAGIKAQYPSIETTTRYREMLESPAIDAVVVATPVSTHARLAREALEAGKHVMVEKPLARTSQECRDLIDLAAERDRVLMVGHTFLYNPAVGVLRDIVQSGEIGDVYYVHAQRLNLGLFQRDINVIWDLAPHDLSILMYVLGEQPVAIGARGTDYVQPGIEDVAHLDVTFASRVRASVHVSWLDPDKVRRITVVGSKKMVVYDDVETKEKLRIYDKGVDRQPRDGSSFGEFQLSYRSGEISIPVIAADEPLRLECQHFLDCCLSGAQPLTDGEQGFQVVRQLEVAQSSLRVGGVPLPLVPAEQMGDAADQSAWLRFALRQVLAQVDGAASATPVEVELPKAA
jgi:predicted dehydrogenase